MSYNPPNVLQQSLSTSREPYFVTLDSSNQQYYSGLSASVYFGDVFMGQLVSLDYQVQEMVLPLFGYGDYTMRRKVHGMRVVRGSFSIMFQQVHLMYQLLNYLKNGPDAPAPSTKTPTTVTGQTLDPLQILKQSGYSYVPQAGSLATLGSLEPSQILTGLSSLSSTVKTQANVDSLGLHKEQIKKIQSQKITQWTQKSGADLDGTEPGDTGLLAGLQGRLSRLYSRYETGPDGFDIHIEMGKPPAGSTVTEWHQSGLPIPLSYAQASVGSSQGFQGQSKNRIEQALQASPRYTTRKLIGCSLTGMAQSLDDSGRPITENYSFLATDLI